MSEVKEITVLAVTKMHGGVCSAGIDATGKWVRPIRITSRSEFDHVGITDHCLLPIDFFHGGRSHLVNLAVTKISLAKAFPQPPHIEDWLLDTAAKPELISKLSKEEQEYFLASHADRDLTMLDPLQVRSLALIEPTTFSFKFKKNLSGDDVAVRASFRTGRQAFADVGCTDLRMRALGRLLLSGSAGEVVELSEDDFRRRGKTATYLAVGLSRLYQEKHWPIVVGVHTIPELEIDIDYARL